MGIIWVGAGIPLWISSDSFGLFALGIIFTVLGLVHHKEWKQNIKDRKTHWKKMSKKEKKKHMLLRWIMFALLLLGVIALGIGYFLYPGF
jgi:membrane protein YdbS with pleckstrin-like domain